jgi:hypothetical protein
MDAAAGIRRRVTLQENGRRDFSRISIRPFRVKDDSGHAEKSVRGETPLRKNWCAVKVCRKSGQAALSRRGETDSGLSVFVALRATDIQSRACV